MTWNRQGTPNGAPVGSSFFMNGHLLRMTVLVLTSDPLPLPNLPATGAGLRAWGLAQGLVSAGIDARALMPASILAGRADAAVEPYASHVFPDDDLPGAIARAKPACIVLQHWGISARVGAVDCPIAIDLAGPHLLERRHWGQEHLEADWQEKVNALRRADFVVCSGRDQRLYFLPWLMQAGFDVADPQLCPAIPFSWSPEGPPARTQPARAGAELTFIAGGVLLPWQNPLPLLQVLLQEMDRAGRGRLIYAGGAHPSINVAGGEVVQLLQPLQSHPRVQWRGLAPLEEWLQVLAQADLAFDLLPRNNERELAFPTRTAMYLWAGLPVLHGHYDELGRAIERRDAGWAIDPGDESALRQALRKILAGDVDVAAKAHHARDFAREHLNWARTIGPLAQFCANPSRRTSVAVADLSNEETPQVQALRRELAYARSDLAALQGKWPFRLARALKKLAYLGAPVIYPAMLVLLACIAVGALIADYLPARKKAALP